MMPTAGAAPGPPATFAGSWQRAVSAVGGRSFLVWEPDSEAAQHEWTYGEFDAVVHSVAARLVQLGVRRGDGVHVALGNSPAFVAVWLACVRMGAYLIPSDPRATVSELAATIGRARPALHIEGTGRDRGEQLSAACPGVPCLTVDEADAGIAELRASPRPDGECAEPRASDTAAVMFTSGTTSQPKGVVVTQANYAFAGAVMAAAAALHAEDRFFVCLPMFHANAQYYCFAAAIHAGASVALVSRFSASRFMDQVERTGATHASLFAAPIRMILQRTETPRTSGYALRHVWFAQNLTTSHFERASRLFGCRPRQLYGMTETIAAVLTSHPLEAAGDVIGPVTLGCSAYVGEEGTGQPVPGGQVGEIHVGGRPGVELFGGYLNDPGATQTSFRGGWFRTGDLAWVDEEGCFHFAGRSGDRIKVGGENVSLLSIETVIAEHPSVAEVAVVGGHDPVLDEVPIAYVVLKPEHEEKSLQPGIADWCDERLAPSRRPRKVIYVPELPHTSVGKVRKHMLKRL